ncbi:MAG: sensor domain-containing diguanylate cyclase [Caldisericia bacterium]|nr:sensor domain-containing diguanylate cyclase [Caldisericia bacterium]
MQILLISLIFILIFLIIFIFFKNIIALKIEFYENKIKNIYKLSELTIKETDLDKLLIKISDYIYKILGFKNVFIYFLDEETNELVLKGTYNLRTYEIDKRRIKLGEGILSKVFETKNWIYIDDVTKEKTYLKVVENIKSEFVYPIFIKNKIKGVLGVESEKSLSKTEIDSLLTIGNLLNISIERIYSIKEIEEKLKLINIINQISNYFLSSLNTIDLLEKIVYVLVNNFGYEKVGILLKVDNKLKELVNFGFHIKNFEIDIDYPKGIITKAFRERKTIVVNDVSKDPDYIEDLGTKSELAVPIFYENEPIGVINIESKVYNRFTESDVLLIETLSNTIGVAIINAKLYEETKKLSLIDELTGLGNFRFLKETVEKEFEKAKRYNLPLSIIFFDLDNFKRINDTKGHQVGSLILVNIARIVQRIIRKSDYAFRYGGDEFVIVLPMTDKEGAKKIADRLKEEINASEIEGVKITASIGISTYPEDAINSIELLEKADKYAYFSKSLGGDRVYY